MAYGDLKVNNLIYDTGSGDASRSVVSIPLSASPVFTGDITINAQGDFRFADSDSSHYVGFQAPATVSTNIVWTLPASDGTNGQQLSTNGSGVLSWSDATNVAAASLSGTTIAANVVTSSLTTVGTLGGLTVDGDVQLEGDTNKDVLWDKSDGQLEFADNAKAVFGTDSDFRVWHDGSHGYLDNDTGWLYVGSDNHIFQNKEFDETYARFLHDGAVELYFNNSTKISTTASGIDVTGTAVLDGITIDGAYEQVAEAVGALEIDCSTGNYFTKTISGNSTFTFANPASSGSVTSFTLELTHSSGTVTWPSSVKWSADTPPTLTTGKTHLFMFVTDDGGTRYRGSALVDYVN